MPAASWDQSPTAVITWLQNNEIIDKYEGHSINKLQNDTILFIFEIWKIRNIGFVLHLMYKILLFTVRRQQSLPSPPDASHCRGHQSPVCLERQSRRASSALSSSD